MGSDRGGALQVCLFLAALTGCTTPKQGNDSPPQDGGSEAAPAEDHAGDDGGGDTSASIDSGDPLPGLAAPLATGQRSDLPSVFFVGNDGALDVRTAADGGAWTAATVAAAPPGAWLATGDTGTLLAVFFVANDGSLSMVTTGGEGTWSSVVPISPPHLFPPGAPVASALQWSGQLDVFATGLDGAIQVFASSVQAVGSTKNAWPQFGVTETGFAPAGAHVALAQQSSGCMSQLDLFVVDANGALQVLTPGPTQTGWKLEPAIATGVAPAGAPVAAVAQAPWVEVSLLDNTGSPKAWAAQDLGNAWTEVSLPQGGAAHPGAPITGMASGTQSYLAYPGMDGAVYGLSAVGTSPWTSFQIADHGFADPMATPAFGLLGNDVVLFVIGPRLHAEAFKLAASGGSVDLGTLP
jgi:hypothetical protein